MNGADLGHRPQGFRDLLDFVGGLKAQVGRVLVKVDGDVVDAGKLVLGNPAPGHPRQAGVPDSGQPPLDVSPRYRGMGKGEAVPLPEVVDEGAVFPHHGGDRPLADDEVAPAGGPSGNGDDAVAGVVEPPEGGVGFGGELAVGGDGVVDIAEDIPELFGAPGRDRGKGFHKQASFHSRQGVPP